MDNLRLRFNHGQIYTYIGEVCVSVNPYRTLNIYDNAYVTRYKGKFHTGSKFEIEVPYFTNWLKFPNLSLKKKHSASGGFRTRALWIFRQTL
ncbi:hypothetical protein WDU94_014329 [Cyamophila willieti]